MSVEEGRILISEFLPGKPGNNNAEFVELYNTGTAFADLAGWSLWYRMDEEQAERRLYTWRQGEGVPGWGHYLLIRKGESDAVGLLPDGEFDVPLFDRRGGLVLRNARGEVMDVLGWGAAPGGYFAGTPAPAPTGGASLERLPGGTAGSAFYTGDNAADFLRNPTPDPQNTGSPLAPYPGPGLTMALTLPESVEPGAELSYRVQIVNGTERTLTDVSAWLPLPQRFTMEDSALAVGMAPASEGLSWMVEALAPGEGVEAELALHAPLLYTTQLLRGGYVEATGWPLRSYAPPQRVAIEGGSLPIAAARTLFDRQVTVEGVATMYTGGFFAGSTGTKFYLEDETGGIQVFCPGGQGAVRVQLGQRVRVTGEIELYRGSVEIIPGTYATDIVILEEDGDPPAATPSTIADFGGDEALLGRLAVVEGEVTRLQEFTYSYELDLEDEEGRQVLVYVEKQTGIDGELLEVGARYRVRGIVDMYDTKRQLKPRLQGDFWRRYPPQLMLRLSGNPSVRAGDLITYTLTASNYTAEPLTGLFVSASVPVAGATVAGVLDGGVLEGAEVTWSLSRLEPEAQVDVRYTVRVAETARERIVSDGAVATAAEWPAPVVTPPHVTYVGDGVPIWAVQGPGMASPYVRQELTTEGIVTGVFPELDGFWIQSLTPDNDPTTSEGLFVLAERLDLEAAIAQGDRVLVHGRVRERSEETLLHLHGEVEVVGRGYPLPVPVELDPPQDEAEALRYYEALEGMLVQVSEPAVAVAPTSQYGEYVLVRQGWGVERVRRTDTAGMLIFVDDGSNARHRDGSTLPYVVHAGDRVIGVLGPLAYTYGNYKVQPLAPPTVVTRDRTLPRLPEAGPNAFTLATFNVENLFDAQLPHPSDPPKPTPAEYALHLAKVADAIVAMGRPTIVALQEVEHLGVLEALAAEPSLVEVGYVPTLIEGTDSRGIDVGYLVRSDRAVLEGVSAHPAPEGLFSRPPLLITVTVALDSGPQTLYVLNNHFVSMSAGEEVTEPRRVAQAAWNAQLVGELRLRDPQAHVAIVGDLNSFYISPPLDLLREEGLRHVYEGVAPERPYSYIYQGRTQTLDHILVTPGLYDYLAAVDALPIGADFPLPQPDDSSARRVSDHNPVIATFVFDDRR